MAKSVFTDEYKIVLQVLIEERENAGLKQGDVTRTLGRPQSYLSKIEHAGRRLDVAEYIALCRAIGVDPVEVMAKVMAALPRPKKRRGRGGTRSKS